MASGDILCLYGAAHRLVLPIYDADGDPVSGAAGLDSEISKDFGSFADCTNEATEIGTSGVYHLDLTATEMQADTVVIRVQTSTSGAKTSLLLLKPRRLASIRAATAQAGAAGSITLDASASAKDGFYTGCLVRITGGTGQGQARLITDYAGSSKAASVAPDWATAPDGTSTFAVLLPDTMGVAAWAGKALADPLADGVPLVRAKDASGNDLATSSALSAHDGKLDAVDGVADAIKAKTDALPASPAAAGDKMDLVDAPNATAVTALQSGLATASALTTHDGKLDTVDANVDAALAKLDSLMDIPVIASSAIVEAGQDVVRRRGDTVPILFDLGRDITGASLKFTVKRRATDAQSAALIAKSSEEQGEIEITDDEAGQFVVNLLAADTSDLLPDGRRTTFLYDVEMTIDEAVETIFEGEFVLIPDVTTS